MTARIARGDIGSPELVLLETAIRESTRDFGM